MPASPLLPLLPLLPLQATLAGTATAHALWQAGASAAQPSSAPQAALPAGCTLGHWTAAPEQPMPTGLVFWLPTPATASAEERALEQACRSQLMQAVMGQHTQLLVLYGAPPQQWRALRDCLLAQTGTTTPPPASAPATWHGHAAGLRCRECLDPASEQRLFSRLLAPGGSPSSVDR